MANREIIKSAMKILLGARLGNSPTAEEIPFVVATWEAVLPDVTDQDLRAACLHLARTAKFWPPPSEVLAASPSHHARQLQAAEAEADDGGRWWPRVLSAVGSLGRTCPDWESKLPARLGAESEAVSEAIIAGVRAVGWRAIAGADHDAQRYAMGQTFRAAYQRTMRRESAGQLALPGPNVVRLDDHRGGMRRIGEGR